MKHACIWMLCGLAACGSIDDEGEPALAAMAEELGGAEDTLVFAHGLVSSANTPYTETYAMTNEESANSHRRTDSSQDWFATAAAGSSGVWYHARYNPTTGQSQLLRSLAADQSGHVVYSVSGHKIDALAIGNFEGTPRLIVGMNHTGGSGCVIWSFSLSSTPTWELLYGYDASWSIDALAAGDFDGDGDDDLAWAYNARDGSRANVWTTDFRWQQSQVLAMSLAAPNRITALTAGDYDQAGHDDLITAISWTSGSTSASSIWRHQGGSPVFVPIMDWDNSRLVDGMASGDFRGATYPGDELMVGFISKTSNPHIRLSPDAWSVPPSNVVSNLATSYLQRNVWRINARLRLAAFRP